MAITINCDTGPKQQNRVLIRQWVERRFTKKRLRTAKVLCLPGWQGREIYEIWDKLGILRRNIHAVTNEPEDYERIRKIKGINAHLLDVNMVPLTKKFYPAWFNCHQGRLNYDKMKQFDIVYLDMYSNLNIGLSRAMSAIHFVKNKGLFGMTWYGAREKGVYRPFKAAIESTGRDNFRISSMIAKMFARVTWNDVRVNIYRDSKDIHFFKVDTPIERKMVSLEILWDALFLYPDVKDLIHKYGSYFQPCALKTKYITKNHTPMLTGFVHLFRCSRLAFNNYMETARSHLYRITDKDIIVITPEQVGTKTPRHMRDDYQQAPAKPAQPKDKAEIIEMLKVGCTPQEVVDYYGIPMAQARAYKAHVTMGTY